MRALTTGIGPHYDLTGKTEVIMKTIVNIVIFFAILALLSGASAAEPFISSGPVLAPNDGQPVCMVQNIGERVIMGEITIINGQGFVASAGFTQDLNDISSIGSGERGGLFSCHVKLTKGNINNIRANFTITVDFKPVLIVPLR
jgi:hypothetical protein